MGSSFDLLLNPGFKVSFKVIRGGYCKLLEQGYHNHLQSRRSSHSDANRLRHPDPISGNHARRIVPRRQEQLGPLQEKHRQLSAAAVVL